MSVSKRRKATMRREWCERLQKIHRNRDGFFHLCPQDTTSFDLRSTSFRTKREHHCLRSGHKTMLHFVQMMCFAMMLRLCRIRYCFKKLEGMLFIISDFSSLNRNSLSKFKDLIEIAVVYVICIHFILFVFFKIYIITKLKSQISCERIFKI